MLKLNNLGDVRLFGVWCTGVLAIGAFGVAAGAVVTTSSVALLLVACLAPSVVLMLARRGASPMMLAAVLRPVGMDKEGVL